MILSFVVGLAVGAGAASCAVLYAIEKDKKFVPSDEQCVEAWTDVNGAPPAELVKKTSIEKARAWFHAWRNVDIGGPSERD